MDLIIDYLQKCAGVFHGFVPGSVFADMVGRVEERLFARGDEDSFHTLGFCAQTLTEMRLFSRALALYLRMLADSRRPKKYIGDFYGQIGNVYFYQRQWGSALENYQQALQWFEKTGNHFQLGGTYLQIGRVYEAREHITNALSFYKTGLLISIQNGNQDAAAYNFNSIARIFPKLSTEQIETLANELGEEVVQKLKESSAS
ncbi:MAG: tetratricopeptide repeat protein [Candidatus Aminicenantes bacterium]|nr:tetratricopeptide repeat protein [Candidatus Aminicenantes bacterium]